MHCAAEHAWFEQQSTEKQGNNVKRKNFVAG